MGPGEFWADTGRTPMTGREIERSLIPPDLFLRAYNRLMPQCVYVSPPAQKWLGELAAALPRSYVRMQGKAQSRIIPVARRQVGIVFFAQGDNEIWDEAAQNDALKAGRELRGAVDLLIGVSPWGSEAERKFAAQADGLYHIILGGGPGYGFASAVTGPNRGVLWARPEMEGSAVTLLELLDWPDPAMHVWENQANFSSQLKLLGPDVPSDLGIVNIFPGNGASAPDPARGK